MFQKQRLANQRDIIRGNDTESNLFSPICEENGIEVKMNYHPVIDIYGSVDAFISTSLFTNLAVQIKSLSVTLTWG